MEILNRVIILILLAILIYTVHRHINYVNKTESQKHKKKPNIRHHHKKIQQKQPKNIKKIDSIELDSGGSRKDSNNDNISNDSLGSNLSFVDDNFFFQE